MRTDPLIELEPNPSRRGRRSPSGRGRRLVRLVLVVILALLVAAGGALATGWYLFLRPATDVPAGRHVDIVIAKGSSSEAIAQALAETGVVPNARMFRTKAHSAGVDGALKAGTYSLTTGMDYDAVLARLAKGPDVVTYDVVVPEGFTCKQIAARFARRTGVSEDELLTLMTSGAPQFASRHPYLAGAYRGSLEGYLFPATYRVKKGVTAEKIVEMMLDKFDEEIANVDLSYAKSKNLTLQDIVIIASAIEREARLQNERALVSSVIYNRLRIGMRLQLCATVLYTMPAGTKRVTYADTHRESPYNTYLHKGLPPGPISNPGRASLEAAAHPKDTRYLYYVLTGSDGSHTFATNFADFERAVAKNRRMSGN